MLGHMVKNSGFTIEKALEVSGIPKDEWDKHISKLSELISQSAKAQQTVLF